MSEAYTLVPLANGTFSIRLLANGETFHPVIGPMAEAEALYIRQLKLRERASGALESRSSRREEAHSNSDEKSQSLLTSAATKLRDKKFVIWDVGLGAGGNVLTTLDRLKDVPAHLHIVSFDLHARRAPIRAGTRRAAPVSRRL